MNPVPLHRGISSFQQEESAFGAAANFREEPVPSHTTPGLEKVICSPDFDAKRLLIRRVTACIGQAIHGLVFEFCDNTRVGCVLDGFARTRLELSDDNIRKRLGVEWQNVDYGDYIVRIEGLELHNTSLLWLCHTLELIFFSGKTIRFEAGFKRHGESFEYPVPQPCLVYRVAFRHEQTQDVRGLITSIHLPISPVNMTHLPLQNKRAIEAVLAALRSSVNALSDDLWWHILGWISAWEVPVVSTDGQEEAGSIR